MASQRFDDDEMTFLDKQGKMFIEQSTNWRDWCPFEPIPWVEDTEWKILEKIRAPTVSKDGSMTSLAASSYTTGTAEVRFFRSHFQWTEMEVNNARTTGNMIASEEMRLAMRKMNESIERFIIQGAMPWDGVAANGLLTNATDVGGTTALDAIYWNVIGTTGALGGPFQHARAAFDVFDTAGYSPPYIWLLGSNLRVGLANPTSDFDNRSARDHIADAFDIEKFVFLPIVPFGSVQKQDDLTTYRLPVPAGDDSRWAMVKADSNNFAVQEIFAPEFTIVPDMNLKNKVFTGYIETAVALRISHPSAVVQEAEVDIEA
jgi:hypothetical protein